MEAKEVVSIILPIYNVEKYLREGLDSVRKQTYKQIEIICVDDGSSDACPEILQEYATKDNRIKIITQENAGTLVARKIGVAKATGHYIMFVDPDDILFPTAVENVVREMKKEECDVVVFGCTFIGEEFATLEEKDFFDKHFNHCLKKFDELCSRTEILTEYFVNHSIPYHQWGKIYRTDLVKNAFAKIPDLRCVFAEDQGTALFIFNHVNRMTFLNKRLYCYRIGMGISTQKQYSIEKYTQCLQSFEMLYSIKAFIAAQDENKMLLEQIGKNIEIDMVRTAVMFIDRLEDETCTDKWLKPLLQKCPNTPLLVKELMNRGNVAKETIMNYESRLNHLSKKNKKHLKQLRIVIIIAFMLLITVVCLLIAR